MLSKGKIEILPLFDRYENIPSVLKYSMFGTGPLTSLGGVEALGFIPTKYANRSLDFPDIEFHIVSGHVGSDGGRSVRRVQAIGDEVSCNLITVPHECIQFQPHLSARIN